MFETVAKEDLPGSHIYENQAKVRDGSITVSLASVISSMRRQGKNKTTDVEDRVNAMEGTSPTTIGEQTPSMEAPMPRTMRADTREIGSTPIEAPNPNTVRPAPPAFHNVGTQPTARPIQPVPPAPKPEADKAGGASSLIRSFRTK